MRDNTLTPTKENAASPQLARVLGFWDVIGIIVGGVIGSGIFIVPAAIAAAVESPILILLVWVAGGLLCFFGALTFAELGASYPQAGGLYIYLREAYGPFVGFLFGWTLFLVVDTGSIATLAVAFSSKYLPHFFAISPLAQKLVALALIAFLAAVNYVGVRWGALLQNLLTIIKFGAILGVCIVVFLFAKGSVAHFVVPAPKPFSLDLFSKFGLALIAVLWAYKGWETTTYSSGEIKNPERNLPAGLFAGALLVIALYLITNLAYLYAFPASSIATSDRIASEVMNMAVGPAGASIIAFVILFSITGAANQNLLCSPRVYFAMARDGLFFKRISDIHPKFLTPHHSILAMAAWSGVLSSSASFEDLFTYVVFGQWAFFVLAGAAVIVLRKKHPDLPRPYKTWGYPVTTCVFVLSALFVSLSILFTQTKNSIAGLAIMALGVPAYFFWKRKQRRPSV